jgi:hypothetical protein
VCEVDGGPVLEVAEVREVLVPEVRQGRYLEPSRRRKSGKKQRCVCECGENKIPRFEARKNLRETEKRVFPRQNKTRSDGEKHSPTQEYLFTICVYDLRGKKQMLLGSDAGRYLIR